MGEISYGAGNMGLKKQGNMKAEKQLTKKFKGRWGNYGKGK